MRRTGRSVSAVLALVTVGCLAETDRTKGTSSRPASIELEIELAGFLGGNRDDQVRDVALGADGSVYLAGGTSSRDFPVTPGAFERGRGPVRDAVRPFDVFVTRLAPDGTLRWSTVLGGPNHDRAYAVEVDAGGFVYVAGRAGAGFPVTANALQTEFRGGMEARVYGPQDGFVCKLEPDGGAIVFCTYFGAGDPGIVRDIAVDAGGRVFLVAARSGGAFPPSVEEAFVNERAGDRDAVVARLSADGSRVAWARHLGGSGPESDASSIRLDAGGAPVVLSTTESSDAETTPGSAFPGPRGGSDLYLARLDPETGELAWATYLGGSEDEITETHELAVTPDGEVYVAVHTRSSDFPVTTRGAAAGYGGGEGDVGVARISADGRRLLGGTFVGGDDFDAAEGIALGDDGRVFVTGNTGSRDFPVTDGAARARWGGGGEAFAVVLSPDLERIEYASYLGGSDDDAGRSAAFRAGRFAIGGTSRSSDWPRVGVTDAYAGGGDGVFAVLRIGSRRPAEVRPDEDLGGGR